MNKKNILIVEDDKFISIAYKDGLSRAGFNVFHANDGKKGLEMAKSEKLDLILLDLIMPEMNGFEVLESLKSLKVLEKTPVVVLSNLGQDSDIKKAMQLGAKDYLIKANFSMAEVIEKINNIIKKY